MVTLQAVQEHSRSILKERFCCKKEAYLSHSRTQDRIQPHFLLIMVMGVRKEIITHEGTLDSKSREGFKKQQVTKNIFIFLIIIKLDSNYLWY